MTELTGSLSTAGLASCAAATFIYGYGNAAAAIAHPAFCSNFRRVMSFSMSGVLLLNLHRADAVILAVTDIKRPALDEDAVRSREFAGKRIAVRAVAALARADHRRNHSISKIDPPDNVVFRVGYVKCAFRGIRDSFRSVKFRRYRGTAVAGVPHFSCSCNQLELASRDIDLEDSVAFAQDQIHFAVRRDVDGARSCQWRAVKSGFCRSIRAFSRACKCGNPSSLCVYFANTIVH